MLERKCCLGSMREWNRARGRFRTGKRNRVHWAGASTLNLFHLTRRSPLHVLFEPSTLHKSTLAHALFEAGHAKPSTPQRACEGQLYNMRGQAWLLQVPSRNIQHAAATSRHTQCLSNLALKLLSRTRQNDYVSNQLQCSSVSGAIRLKIVNSIRIPINQRLLARSRFRPL